MEQDDNYQQKKKLIEERDKGELENLRHSIENLQLEKKQTIVTPISELFDENIFKTKLNSEDFKEIKNNEYYNLLSFLIKESFIDENYNSYMNYFYDNDLKKEDIIFLRELYAGKINEPEYELNSLESIIEILENEDYSRKGILNYSIFEFLLKKEAFLNEKSSKQINPLLHEKLLENIESILYVASQEKNIKFILGLDSYLFYNYRNEGNIDKRWYEILFTTWLDFCVDVIDYPTSVNISLKYTRMRLLFSALKYLDSKQIDVQNKNQKLKQYLEKNINILRILDDGDNNIIPVNLIKNLKSLNIEFVDIGIEFLDHELISMIIGNNFYELNYINLEKIAKFSGIISENSDLESFRRKNLSYIMQSNNKPLKTRVSDNLNDYIKLYLEFSNGVIYDSDITMLHVLNDASVENKNSYLKATKHRIENIKDVIDQSIWSILLENDSVQGNFANIVYYFIFSKKKWESELIEFVNRSHSEIQVNIEEISEESFEFEEFVDATIKLNDLDNDRYREIVGYGGHKITTLDKMPNDLPESKIETLIDCSVLPMRGDVLGYVRRHYPKHMTHFALHNIEGYMELINENYDEKYESELSSILNSNIITNTKKEILSKLDTKNKISIRNINIKSDILSIILDRHLKDSEIPTLFEVYSQYEFEVRYKILEIAKENIELMKSNDCDKRLVIKVLKSDLDIKIRRSLFVTKISMMDYEDILNLVSTIDLSKAYEYLTTSAQMEFENTGINVVIINHLEKIGIISSQFLEDDFIIVKVEK
ncbi:hypothetical protein [Marinilactibacillus kalidii]|uniref:hypothetical protein n=1 Tax=Marinilactibacillus kalidii TaxID=2820274 RepID=UPI001ABED34A|nr:hypothetical protein [Marinilactibacillus kalidii]